VCGYHHPIGAGSFLVMIGMGAKGAAMKIALDEEVRISPKLGGFEA
jgi:hypothetical protein